MAIGGIYGPNENNVPFYNEIRSLLEGWKIPFILGGDFNTILDDRQGEANLDKIGGGRIPNIENHRRITNWLETGEVI
jgi:hypothetical protein